MHGKILDFIHTLLLTEIGISHSIIYIILNILNKIKLYFTLAKLYNVCNLHTIYIYFCINIIPMTII